MEERTRQLTTSYSNTFEQIALLCLLIMLSVLTVSAQTQTGIVKTRGRLVNGNVIAGQRLSGATVQVKGRNAVVTNANGAFSFPVPSNRFVVQSVKKKGYMLVDPEATARQYAYSSNPLIFVLETPDQLMEDKLANERRIRRTLERQLHAKEDEIEALREQNRITQEEYRKALQELYAQQESNERLISDMAERYSQIDYDQLDEFNQRISDCILNGRLTEADSLLRSKGDMKSRIATIRQEEEIEAAEAAELAQRQENLEKSKAGTKASKEEAARDCYSFYERFLMEHQNDSAAYYLELRASIDTTNVEWLNDAGAFLLDIVSDYPLALEYIQKSLNCALKQQNEKKELVAVCYGYLGGFYSTQGDYSKALEYYRMSLDILLDVLGDDHYEVALCYNNIGIIHIKNGNYQLALGFLNKALDIRVSTLDAESPEIVNSYISMGYLYLEQEEYDRAFYYYNKAIEIETMATRKSNPILAATYNNIGAIFSGMDSTFKALEFYKKALDARREIYGDYHPSVASSYNNMGTIFYYEGNYTKALEYYQMALDIRKEIQGNHHPSIAKVYNNIGVVYDDLKNYDKALEYFQMALDINIHVFSTNHPSVATSYINIGVLYINKGDYDKTLEYLQKALCIRERVFGAENPKTQRVREKIDEVKKLMAQEPSTN